MVGFSGGVAGFLDFEESERFSKVLQGQENMSSFMSPVFRYETAATKNPRDINCVQRFSSGTYGFPRANTSIYTAGLVESSANRFFKGWQGQESSLLISKNPDYTNIDALNLLNSSCFTNFPKEMASFSNEVERTKLEAEVNKLYQNSINAAPISLKEGEGNIKNLNLDNGDFGGCCKLFGFQLTSELPASVSATPQTSSKRSCTKV